MKFYKIILSALLILLLTAPYSFSQVDRSKPPKLGSPDALKLPPIQEFTLSNGLKIIFMEKHEVPLMQVNVVIKAGRVNDPENETGLATMTADMLDEGAGGLDALQLADAIDFLGASISTSAGYHTTEIDLHTPLSKLDKSLNLLADVVLNPAFAEKELMRLKKDRITTLLQWHDQPTSIASVLFSESLFGNNHPYGKTSIGSEKEINSLSVNDIKKFYSSYFKSNNAFVVVVGDIKSDSLKPMLESVFGKWENGNITEVNLPDAPQVEQREILIVDKPGSAQSVIQIGRIGVPRNTEDYFSILVMNTILGGSFSSRLNQNLREEHGYTYGAYSYFSFRPSAGPMGANASVQTDVTDSSLVQFFKELDGIVEPIPDEEIDKAKNYVALSYPRDFQTVANIAARLIDMEIYGLPKDYFNNYVSNILAVTKSEVMDAAKKYILPGKFRVIVVGDRQKIEQGIKNLNLGEIKYLTIDDVLGKPPVTTEAN